MLRVIFFGTPHFSVPTLEALLASPHQVLGVVTQPDRPRGRGQHVAEPPTKTVAQAAGLPVWQPDRLKDDAWLTHVRALGADVAVVAAYGKILPQVLLDIPPCGFVNVHASLLPRYRGASPIQHAVMSGDAVTGVTIMRIVLALDAGPMISQATIPIGPDDTSDQVEAALALVGAGLLVDTLDAIEAGRATETPQDDGLATYAPRLTKDDGTLDWTQRAEVLHNRVRGLKPWPQAFTFAGSSRLVVVGGRVDDHVPPAATAPGTVLPAPAGRLLVAAGERTVFELLQVQPEGRRVMPAAAFLAGHRLPAGTRLGSSAP
jgi:methionyl-tRNA formyltransferase